jgi:hypothetical protein
VLATRGADFGHPRQRRHDRLYRGDLLLGKAAGLLRGPGGSMDRAVAEDERRGHVVGGALLAQLCQHRGIGGPGRRVEAVAHRRCRLDHAQKDAVAVFGLLQSFVRQVADADILALAPDEPTSGDLRVQGAHKDGGAPQRDPRRHKPLAEHRQHLLRCRGGAGAVDQPIGDRRDLRPADIAHVRLP